MENTHQDVTEKLVELLEVTRVLRGPEGCPWDRSRSPEDIRTSLLEETYELMEALDRDDTEEIREEMGDVLYQVVFLSDIYAEKNTFDLASVLSELKEKLVRRHPHVFGDADASTPEEGVEQWEEAKNEEKEEDDSVLSGVPDHLPALLRAYRITEKVSAVGFDWSDEESAFQKVREELQELEQSVGEGGDEEIQEELGDLLFSCANLARKLGMDPEQALRKGSRKFQATFRRLENRLDERDQELDRMSQEELVRLWNAAAKSERNEE